MRSDGGASRGGGERHRSGSGDEGRRAGRRRRFRPGRALAALVGLLILFGVGYGGAYVYAAVRDLPSLDAPDAITQTSFIYDINGNRVEAVPGASKRVPLPSLAAVPLAVQHAFVAKEDSRFYQNPYGIDIRGVLRALWTDIVLRRPAQGGSTITQQLARHRFPIGSARTLRRKIQEAILAVELARHYTKSEIMTMYLNDVYFGQGAWGIAAAAQTYFGEGTRQLTLPQGALLAGLVRAPSVYDPYAHANLAVQQRNIVLDLMAQQHYITPQQAAAARAETLAQMGLQPVRAKVDYKYPFYIDAVVTELRKHFSDSQIYGGGLRVYAALNPVVQQAAQDALPAVLDKPFPLSAKPHLEAAAVVLDQANGYVEAIVGGREHPQVLGFDRATQALRQTGSSMKPLAVYTPALQAGMTAATVIDDSPQAYPDNGKTWVPRNDNNHWDGLTTIREAVRRSVNVVAVKVLDKIGIARGYQSAVRMGVQHLQPKDQNLSLALGGVTDCCTPLEMARAYATIANGGYRVTPLIVLRVTDADGNVLFQATPVRTKVVSPQVAYVMTNIMESVVEPQPNNGWIYNWGTAPAAAVPNWPTAGKTGTTSQDKDAWFIGFTPRLTAAVWAGYDTPRAMNQVWGGAYGAPIFRYIMRKALAGQTPTDFPRPSGIVTEPIDAKSGLLPGPLTPSRWIRTEVFVQGTQPTTTSGAWVRAQVDSANPSLLWDSTCGAPPVSKVFLNRPPVTVASVRDMAKILALPAPQLIPSDMALAPPTKSCSQATPGGPTPTATGTATGPTRICAFPQGDRPESCTITLTAGAPMEPAVIEAFAGHALQLDVVAVGGPHRLLIPGLNIDRTLQAGQRATILRTPPAPGTYPIADALAPGQEGAVLLVQTAPAAATPSAATGTGG